MEKKPEIDAVRMVRRIRDAPYEELKKATREERIAFFNSKVRQADTSKANPERRACRSSA